jgi:hypothetical protein
MQRPFLSAKARLRFRLGVLAASASWIAAAVGYYQNQTINWFLLSMGILWIALGWDQGRRADEGKE